MVKIFILAAFLSYVASISYASTPEEVIKKMVNAIKLKKYGKNLCPSDNKHNVKMTHIAASCFDIDSMAKTALAEHWNEIDSETKKKLISKIKDLVIILSYPATDPNVQKIQIIYCGNKIKNDKATVYSLLIVKDKELKIDYQLHKKNKKWLTYDVLSEQRSLIADYKKQFNRVIEKYSVEKLLEILDKKIKKNNSCSQ